MNDIKSAHLTLPFGTIVEVISLTTGEFVQIRINDRRKFTPDLIIDLSKAAATEFGIARNGINKVEIKVVSSP